MLRGFAALAGGSVLTGLGGWQELPNVLGVRALAVPVRYRFTVSGRVVKGDASGQTDTLVDQQTVEGFIRNVQELDDYRFSGSITSFEITEGQARVTVNGEEVADPTGLPGGETTEPGTPEPTGTPGGFSVVQDGECVPITPLSGDQPVTEFYGYTTERGTQLAPNQANLPGTLEEAGVSRLFLYRGPEALSLVVVHSGGERGVGGAASFEITGLPTEGEWVVQDDNYDPGDSDTWQVSRGATVVDWAWNETGSDGGVFAGLGSDFEVQIEPAFDEAAALEPGSPGEVEAWQVLSGDVGDPEVVELAMDRPIIVRSASC